MAPKKSSKNNNTIENKTTRGRAKPDKRNPKSPNNIKIEVSVNNNKSSESLRRVSRKQILTYENKIELANEVVKHQLNRHPNIFNFDKKLPISEIVHNRAKLKTVVSKYFQTQNGINGKANGIQKKKGTKTITIINKTEEISKQTTNKKASTRKRSADSTQNTEKCQKGQKHNVQVKRRRTSENRVMDRKVPEKEITEGKNNVTGELKDKRKVSSSTMVNVQADGAECRMFMCAGRIDSRKTSSTSTSCMSWTKDLSSTSKKSVIVTNNDFVRIDNKLPIVQLTSIDNKVIHKNKQPANDKDILLDDSDSSYSTDSEKSIDLSDIKSLNLNLSTSSLTSLPSINNEKSSQNNSKREELNKAFDKLTSKLNHFDVEIIRWIGYGQENTDVNMKDFQDKVLKTLKEECEVMTHCKHLKIILSKDVELKAHEKESQEIDEEMHVDKLDAIPNDLPEYLSKGTKNSIHQIIEKSVSDTECHDEDHAKLKSNETYDDDDAISIYAESITGIESEKLNNSMLLASKELEHSEYIPEPVQKTIETTHKYTYCPTNISENNKLILKRTVCEKQNADSTSIFKENYLEPASVDDDDDDMNSNYSENNHDNIMNDPITKLTEFTQIAVSSETLCTTDARKPQGHISCIFKNICKFNLLRRCKIGSRCRFLHVVPDVMDIKNKFYALNDAAFISEYMAIRNIYPIYRKYGICFVEECCNRDMPRVLLDMAKCFFMKANIKDKDDNVHIREILECVLLKLNNVDLNIYEDLLMHSVTSTMLLCDVFMQTIAETQNFSRFKLVFLNLTHFITTRNGIFNLLVAESILERVCILPSEKSLSRALLNIIKNTDAAIFRNKMIGKFENTLLSLDKKLHGDLLAIKMEAVGCLLSSPSDSNLSSQYNNNVKPVKPANTFVNIGDKSHTSPDTTDINSLKNKFTGNMKLVRRVNLNSSCMKEVNQSKPSNGNVENWQKNFNKWSQKSPRNIYPVPLLSMSVTRPVLDRIKSKRHIAYRSPVTGHQRWPLKDF